MRSLPVAAALSAALLLAGPPAAGARTPAAGTRSPRCPKGTVALRTKRKLTACVPRAQPTPSALLKAGAALSPRAPRGSTRPSARARRSAQRTLALLTARARANESPFGTTARSATRATATRATAAKIATAKTATPPPRAHKAETDPTFGEVLSRSESPDGRYAARFRQDDGIEVTVEGRQRVDADDSKHFEAETRDRSGAGITFGYGEGQPTPSCPAAGGDVPTRHDAFTVAGQATASHGKRTWFKVTTRVEGRWHGYVGVGARAERFDVDVLGVTEVRSGVEIAATGKVLRRNATRVYRTVLRRRGLPVGATGEDAYDALDFRGPKGRRIESADMRMLGLLVAETAAVVEHASDELRKGDERWFEQRSCARTTFDHAPAHVTKGGRVDWNLTALAADGAVAADARWTPTSTCGVLTASTTTGPRTRLTVVDAARAWGPLPPTPGCVAAELTSTAGRPPAFAHEVPPEELRRLKVNVAVRFHKNMGTGIVETSMRGSGEVLLGDPSSVGVHVDGSGTYNGTEWDGTPENSCGMDMLRTRDFAGRAAVGAQRNDDGTISVAFSAPERPYEMSWIVVVPATGGSETIRAAQPFCGQPGLAQTLAEVTVTTQEVPVG
ncbi:hypothetical protein [Conexibacter woesei]|uniref:Uncharacterized protein n=1 Tax=Conexibacter woesei (strain DSM 14684 / CCUG 47730 / CIP 108061 / JCM 11494 / NBRC 100937 / ID131577) TaxID=469383 RepID=D3F462_CONWI|nr:hypothetical protein [Conexibacter woesei]ADB50434.1 hypothetical protein Cwoe_2008 [Conexibacter woesei DSM 14684]